MHDRNTRESIVLEKPAPMRSGLWGLDAYRVGIEFYRRLRRALRTRRGHVVDQVMRAAESSLRVWMVMSSSSRLSLTGAEVVWMT